MDTTNLLFIDIETAGQYPHLSLAMRDQGQDAERERLVAMAESWSRRAAWLRGRYPDLSEYTDSELYAMRSPLHAEYAQVVCVSIGLDGPQGLHVRPFCLGEKYRDEASLLHDVQGVLNNSSRMGHRLCGYNIERFDIPFLWKRMLSNGITPPPMINLWSRKPWDWPTLDLAKLWSNGVWQESYASFDALCLSLGVRSSKSDMSGADVHARFWSGHTTEIAKYCDEDVRAVYECVCALNILNIY